MFFLSRHIIKEPYIHMYSICFRILRYEDFSLDIWNQTHDIFKFLGLDFTEESMKFLVDHTHEHKADTYRNPKDTPFKWKQSLDWNQILEVQNNCHEVLKLWGYRVFNSKEELNNDPLLKFSF